jgi:hypothetical protein
MDVRNWEYFVDNGLPVVGATVKARDAVLTHPNTGTVLATTSTDSNGMWAFVGLTDTPKDVEVIWGASSQYHRWYKGMAKTGVSALFFEGQTGLLSAGGWTNAPTVTGALGANSINVATTGAAAGEIKATTGTFSGGLNAGTTGAAAGEVKTSSHAKIGGTVFPSGQTSQGFRALTPTTVPNTGTNWIVVGVNSVGLLYVTDPGITGDTALIMLLSGAGVSTSALNSNATTWNLGTDAGTNWAVFRDGATGEYRIKNRSSTNNRIVAYVYIGT